MYGNPKPSMKVLRELSSPVEVLGLQQAKKGKLTISLAGSVGLPQHEVRGYKLYISDSTHSFSDTRFYDIPTLQPGKSILLEVDDQYNGKGIVTIVRPTGFVVSQRSFY
jgi:beta-galactosidase